jgi:hypothetical protein
MAHSRDTRVSNAASGLVQHTTDVATSDVTTTHAVGQSALERHSYRFRPEYQHPTGLVWSSFVFARAIWITERL